MGDSGDISEIRGLVVVVSFLGLLVLLMALIPSSLYTVGSVRAVSTPTQWEGIDIQSFQSTWNSTTINDLVVNFAIGGRNLRWNSLYSNDYIQLLSRYGFLLIFTEPGDWYNRQGIKVSQTTLFAEHINTADLDTDYSSYGDIRFVVKFDSEAVYQVNVIFSFNETTYASPSLAWASDDLDVLVGVNFDNIGTSYNAWDLIAMLLFFQLPNIDTTVNAIIAIPIWVAVAYLAYVLIIKVIPLI